MKIIYNTENKSIKLEYRGETFEGSNQESIAEVLDYIAKISLVSGFELPWFMRGGDIWLKFLNDEIDPEIKLDENGECIL